MDEIFIPRIMYISPRITHKVEPSIYIMPSERLGLDAELKNLGWKKVGRSYIGKVRAYIDLHRPEPRSAEDEDFLFIQEIKRNRANGPYLRYSMHQYALKLGIEKSVHPHTLRHSRIKWLRQKNFSWEKILSLTGHASLMSLSDYIQGEELDKLQIALDELKDPTETQTPQSPQELRAALLEKENERLKLELEVLKFQIQGQEVSKPDQKTRMNNIGYM